MNTQNYEILIRFGDKGILTGCHQQKLLKNSGFPDQILPPQPVDLDDLADVVGVATAEALTGQMALQKTLEEQRAEVEILRKSEADFNQILTDLTTENTALLAEIASLKAEIEALKAPKQPDKATVTMAQARLALMSAGLFKQVDDGLNLLPEPQKTTAKTAWEYSPNVSRTGALITTLAGLFGLSEQQLDELFTAAAAIEL